MRYSLFVVLAALMTVASASAQDGQKKKKSVPQTRKTVPVEDVSQRPDLTIPGVNWASRDLYIPVQNRGASATTRTTQVRVAMYRKDSKGIMQLVSTGFGTLPIMQRGSSTSVKVTMNQEVVNCTIIVIADYMNYISEVNENNNSFQVSYK
jgi:hypothetical protein